MKNRLTIVFIFSTVAVVSMVFALPLSNNGQLTFSVSEANSKSNQLPIVSNASYVYSVSESNSPDAWDNESGIELGDARITPPNTEQGLNPKSVTATMLLFCTGLVGLVGIGRNKG